MANEPAAVRTVAASGEAGTSDKVTAKVDKQQTYPARGLADGVDGLAPPDDLAAPANGVTSVASAGRDGHPAPAADGHAPADGADRDGGADGDAGIARVGDVAADLGDGGDVSGHLDGGAAGDLGGGAGGEVGAGLHLGAGGDSRGFGGTATAEHGGGGAGELDDDAAGESDDPAADDFAGGTLGPWDGPAADVHAVGNEDARASAPSAAPSADDVLPADPDSADDLLSADQASADEQPAYASLAHDPPLDELSLDDPPSGLGDEAFPTADDQASPMVGDRPAASAVGSVGGAVGSWEEAAGDPEFTAVAADLPADPAAEAADFLPDRFGAVAGEAAAGQPAAGEYAAGVPGVPYAAGTGRFGDVPTWQYPSGAPSTPSADASAPGSVPVGSVGASPTGSPGDSPPDPVGLPDLVGLPDTVGLPWAGTVGSPPVGTAGSAPGAHVGAVGPPAPPAPVRPSSAPSAPPSRGPGSARRWPDPRDVAAKTALTARPAARTGRPAKPGRAPKRPPQPGKVARRAHLEVLRIEPWSVMKFSFVVSVVCFIVLFVAVAVLYGALAALGVFDSLQRTIQSVTSGQGSGGVNAASWFSASHVLGYAGLIGAVNVILITALATIGAVLYNVAADLVGGIEVTLRETE